MHHRCNSPLYQANQIAGAFDLLGAPVPLPAAGSLALSAVAPLLALRRRGITIEDSTLSKKPAGIQ